MKVEVLSGFRDKHTREFHEKGEVLTVSKERYEEILTVGNLVKEIKTVKKPKTAN